MYDEIAKGYDELYGEEQEKKLKLVAHVIKGRVLDIGAGTGIVAKRFPNVVSLDPSKDMLKFVEGEKIVGKAEDLPFKAKEFETIVSLTALHHCDIDKVVSELKRMEAPNMAFTILKKSKKCEEIVEKLVEAFNMKVVEEEKDVVLVKYVEE